MSLKTIKFPLQVYTYKGGSDYYDLTLDEMQKKCCIYGTNLYWKKCIPVEEERFVDTFFPTLYDIYSYQLSYWYEWPAELKKYVEDAYEEHERMRAANKSL